MSLAIKWKMRTDNPCRGIERNQEQQAPALSLRRRAGAAHQGAGRARRSAGSEYRATVAADWRAERRDWSPHMGSIRSRGRHLDQARRDHEAEDRPRHPAVGTGAAACSPTCTRRETIPATCSPAGLVIVARSRIRGPRSARPPASKGCASTICATATPAAWLAPGFSLPIIGALLGHTAAEHDAAIRASRRTTRCAWRPNGRARS